MTNLSKIRSVTQGKIFVDLKISKSFCFMKQIDSFWKACLTLFETYFSIVTRQEIVCIQGPFSYNFWNMSKLTWWPFTEKTDLPKCLPRASSWGWHWINLVHLQTLLEAHRYCRFMILLGNFSGKYMLICVIVKGIIRQKFKRNPYFYQETC